MPKKKIRPTEVTCIALNMVWKGGTNPAFPLLFHQNPASRTFSSLSRISLFLSQKYIKTRLISAESTKFKVQIGPFDWYFALAWLICLCR